MKKIDVRDFKKVLNPSQWDAVTTVDGPVLVVAGAGTGKTRVIEYRCLYMVEQGVTPQSILLLTFTRRAAREMLGRASLHDPKCRHIEGGTFHSFAYRMIQRYKSVLGLQESISFMDEADSADALHLLSARLGYLEDKTRFPKKDTLRAVLSMSLNRHQTIREILAQDYPHFAALAPKLEELRKKYAEYKISRNLIDYDDMLIYLKFLLENPSVQEKVSRQFKYVMVDEFQDTNKIQADIVYALARDHRNCMAVGDDTQSIYSFRGAYYKNMFDFPSRFPDTKIIKLEYNYRSTQPILDVANAIVAGEKQKYTKVLFTTCAGEEKPTLSFFKDASSEAEWIAGKIKEYRDTGVAPGSMGVLFRSNYLSLPVQIELSKRNIPFAVYGGMKFIETAHIKDVVSFLKVHHNPKDELALARILMLLDGVGPRTAEKVKELMAAASQGQGAPVWKETMEPTRAKARGSPPVGGQALGGMPKRPILIRTLKGAVCWPRGIKSPGIQKELSQLMALLRDLKETPEIQKKIKKIIHFYTPILKAKFDDYQIRQDDLKAFAEIAASYMSIEQFLMDFVALEPPEKSVARLEGKTEDERPAVLSTIHSAKGLEWDVVFIMALMDGSLPVSYALDDEESVEEERRLLYVAVTRARQHLHLSMHNEGRQGGMESFNRLSRFISESRVMEKIETDASWFEEEVPVFFE